MKMIQKKKTFTLGDYTQVICVISYYEAVL